MSLNAHSDAKRVLIYRMGSLGDTIVALPALHLVARAFPTAERRILTNFPINIKAPSVASILENAGLVHGYFRYVVATRSIGELLRLWWQIARWRPDVLVYLGPKRGVAAARRDAKFFRLCGIKRLVGVPITEELQFNRVEADGQLEYEAARLARNLAALGNARLDDPASWDLHLTAEEKQRAQSALAPLAGRPVIAASVGTKAQSRDWGRDNWRALLRCLAEAYPSHGLVLNGAPDETGTSEFVAEGWREVSDSPVVNLCGQLPPRESAAVYALAQIFIGHDSGPLHLAAAMQVPCVAIFSARTIPRVWFPYGHAHHVIYHRVDCAGCLLDVCIVQAKKCLTSITIDEVFSHVKAVME